MNDRKTNFFENIDWMTIGMYLILVFLGWLNIYAAVYNEDHKNIFDFSQRYGLQMIWIVLAFIIILVVFLFDAKFFTIFAYPIYGIAILTLLLVLVVGKEVNGAKAWLGVGSFGVQPSEFAKAATSLAIAKYLSSFNVKIHSRQSLTILGGLILVPVGLILIEPDMGSVLVFASLFLVLYREGLTGYVLFSGIVAIILFFVALIVSKVTIIYTLLIIACGVFLFISLKKKQALVAVLILWSLIALFLGINRIAKLNIPDYFLLLSATGASLLFFLIYSLRQKIQFALLVILFLTGAIGFTFSVDYVFNQVLEKHQRERIDIILGNNADTKGSGYNLNQSKIAIGSGGLIGKGFLQGTQTKYDFVPEQSTDFIFCTIGEEWGFIGSFVVIVLFILFILRIIWLAERQRSVFSRVYGYCVASIIFIHVFINIAMTTGMIPVIGIPLPFFSYGGSSLWAFTILLFIFLRFDANRRELLK